MAEEPTFAPHKSHQERPRETRNSSSSFSFQQSSIILITAIPSNLQRTHDSRHL